MGLREDRFERVTELFYEAAAVPEMWPDALDALAEASGATGAVLLPTRPGPLTAIASPGISELIAEYLSEGWHLSNPRVHRGRELTAAGWQGLITDRDMFGDQGMPPGDYASFLERHGFGPVAGMVLVRASHDLIVSIAIERRLNQGPFTGNEVLALNRLMAQIKAAAALAVRIGFSGARRFADGIAAIGEDAVLLGDFGNVLHVTPGFERHVGGAFVLRAGRLAATDAEADCRLAAVVASAVQHGPAAKPAGGGFVVPRRDGRPLFVRVVPMAGAQDVFSLARAAVIVTDPERGGSQTFHILIETFGLSAAEARLARRIGRGETLRDIAAAERMSVETMRTRLKSVFAKTRTHRQAELALLVASMSR